MIKEKLATLESEVQQMMDEIESRNAYINRALGAIEVLRQLIAAEETRTADTNKEESNEDIDNNSGGKEQEQAANGEGN